jgi:hypothetical protein
MARIRRADAAPGRCRPARASSRFTMSNSPPPPGLQPGVASFFVARMQCGGAVPLARPPRISSGLRTSSSPFPPNGEGAKRREPPVRIAAPHACHDAARIGHLTRRPAPSNVGRSPLGASPRRLFGHGPDARLLWHHSLGIAAQALGRSAQGRDSVAARVQGDSNPARRRRSRLQSCGLSLPQDALIEPG